MKTAYKILLVAVIGVAVSIPTISAISQKPIDAVRCLESEPYPNVMEASEAAEYFMGEYGFTTFVSGSVNFPDGMHSQNKDLPTTITLCIRESSTFMP